MKDMSHLLNLETGLTAGSSMSAGNTISDNELAMTAPGSTPVNADPVNPTKVDDPALAVSTDDKDHKSSHSNGVSSSDASWKKV